jgi:hypothetical protein
VAVASPGHHRFTRWPQPARLTAAERDVPIRFNGKWEVCDPE